MGRGGHGTMSRGRGAGPAIRGRVPPPLTRARGSRGGTVRGIGGAAAAGQAQANNRGPGQRGNLAGKRKFDGGHQNQGDSKRRFQNWGSQPIAQQPLGVSGYSSYASGTGDVQWYHDSYAGQQWG